MPKASSAPKNRSKSDIRKSQILKLLLGGGQLVIKDLAKQLDVSLMTIHRDLADLEANGAITRVRGAISAEKSVLFESSYLYREQKHVAEKRRLAQAAIKHISAGMAVVWDDSTTVFQVSEFIRDVTPITVLSNGLPVLDRLATEPGVEVIALGGKYHRGFNGFFGIQCEQAIKSYRVDVALMSSTTVEGNFLYTQDEHVVRIKRAMLEAANTSILLIDSSKFEYSALNKVADLRDFDHVIVSKDTDQRHIDALTQAGVKLELA
ncbi:MAG: DeoR/GlpR family DNA-binding transcription regulator [Sedimentitalea sp.]|uniref:DeoR/GlpR family DNA-binding transcription regulator n=1 Tax=Sedimentitalea sp. TaxID=2048915 RepID=UPI003265BB30